MKKLKKEKPPHVGAAILAGLLFFVGLPFLLYLFWGFLLWLCNDPFNIINL